MFPSLFTATILAPRQTDRCTKTFFARAHTQNTGIINETGAINKNF